MAPTQSDRILELAQRQRLLSAADVRAQGWSPQLLVKLKHGGIELMARPVTEKVCCVQKFLRYGRYGFTEHLQVVTSERRKLMICLSHMVLQTGLDLNVERQTQDFLRISTQNHVRRRRPGFRDKSARSPLTNDGTLLGQLPSPGADVTHTITPAAPPAP